MVNSFRKETEMKNLMKRMMVAVAAMLGIGGCTMDANVINEGIGTLTTVCNLLKQFGILTCVMLALCLSGGCSANHAIGDTTDHAGLTVEQTPLGGTTVKFNSNGKASVDEVIYDKKAQTLKVTKLKIDQDAATAAKYDASKIEKTGVAQEWQTHWVQASWAGATSFVHEIAPVLQLLSAGKFVNTSSGFNIEIPNYLTAGKTKTTDASQVQSIIQSLATQAEQLQQATTTQPAKEE
jgi:hypothetical protein